VTYPQILSSYGGRIVTRRKTKSIALGGWRGTWEGVSGRGRRTLGDSRSVPAWRHKQINPNTTKASPRPGFGELVECDALDCSDAIRIGEQCDNVVHSAHFPDFNLVRQAKVLQTGSANH